MLDAQCFRRDWEANGPMVPNLDPMEATDRLRKFQQMFEVGSPAVAGVGWTGGWGAVAAGVMGGRCNRRWDGQPCCGRH